MRKLDTCCNKQLFLIILLLKNLWTVKLIAIYGKDRHRKLPLRSKCNKRICASYPSIFFHLFFASITAQRQTKQDKSKTYSYVIKLTNGRYQADKRLRFIVISSKFQEKLGKPLVSSFLFLGKILD